MIENQIIINNFDVTKLSDRSKEALVYMNVSSEILKSIFLDSFVCYLKHIILSLENCPSELMDIAYNNNYYNDLHIKRSVAQNKNCPIYILENLSFDSENNIRIFVANNPNCSLELLENLSDDENVFVRRYVVENPKCSLKILEKLSKDKDPFVKYYVTKHKNCSLEILEKSSNDSNVEIRKACVMNKKCPKNTLIKLYKEFPNEVIKHPNCPDYLKVLSK